MHSVARLAAPVVLALAVSLAQGADAPRPWPPVALPDARAVELSGPLGAALQRGVARLAQAPFTAPWLLADVSFETKRIFTNYSGDASGRFIELAALTSPRDRHLPAALDAVLAAIPRHQKPDGHFGVPVDLAKPLAKGSPPIPMLWGNARLLVGLVACAQQFRDPQLLAAAKRLGDFYVATADLLCSPAREAEYRASGTYGDSYTCCYFPAIESLALLYRVTNDGRYLTQARRMAELFAKFDRLPIDHSHGNLCAWRGILMLHEITGDRSYLERARAKWDAATQGGYVWPTGGIGEHWNVFFSGDEGCSESDWLRFNLDLWRFTGEVRYLDLAERLLHNQYAMNQCPNGGYGLRHFDGDAAGPVGTRGGVEEWAFCCSFHGPLGLHVLKSYLASGSDRGVFVNFPLDFSAPVRASGRDWQLAVRSQPEFLQGRARVEIELAPKDGADSARTTLWVRIPEWATGVQAAAAEGAPASPPTEGSYLRIERSFKAGEKLSIAFQAGLRAEGRRFQRIRPEPGEISRLRDVALLSGPHVLFAAPVGASGRPTLLATVDAAGHLELPSRDSNGYATLSLPSLDATEAQIASAVESARPVLLRPWPAFPKGRRMAFMCDLVVVPAQTVAGKGLERLAERAGEGEKSIAGPFFGENLEKRQDIWLGSAGWKFTPDGLHVSGGDIGLMDGEGYGDYRFEFELVLPKEGQGVAGWVVRAASADDCVMFQLQSADSTLHAPEFKTRPNTLRPHLRRNGQWTLADPIPLPKEVRRGEAHQVAVECRGDNLDVFLDGEKIHSQSVPDLRAGAVGFRAAGPAEQGLYRRIALRKL